MSTSSGDPAAVDHYGSQYANFRSEVLAAVRREAFVDDFGQNGWQTAAEQERFAAELELRPGSRLLDVACGSGGPALRQAERTGCSVLGIDLHPDAIATATSAARERDLQARAAFLRADASLPLELEAEAFDAVLCIDAINHLPDRARALAELARVLKPGARLLYTDPIVVTGWLSDLEMRIRSSIGSFLFVAPGVNERFLGEAGFDVLSVRDATESVATMARRWHVARAARADALREIEGADAFEGQQRFFDVAARLAEERRLSRFVFLAAKPRS